MSGSRIFVSCYPRRFSERTAGSDSSCPGVALTPIGGPASVSNLSRSRVGASYDDCLHNNLHLSILVFALLSVLSQIGDVQSTRCRRRRRVSHFASSSTLHIASGTTTDYRSPAPDLTSSIEFQHLTAGRLLPKSTIIATSTSICAKIRHQSFVRGRSTLKGGRGHLLLVSRSNHCLLSNPLWNVTSVTRYPARKPGLCHRPEVTRTAFTTHAKERLRRCLGYAIIKTIV